MRAQCPGACRSACPHGWDSLTARSRRERDWTALSVLNRNRPNVLGRRSACEMVHAANTQAKWQFDHQVIEPLQFTQYDGDKEQRYDWHVDHFLGDIEETIRKISFTILLNDDFEGGEFEIEAGSPVADPRIHEIKLKKGDAVLFPSYQWHRVRPVTKGTRHSLVGWVRGPQWR